ncbi:MAG: aspartate kinase [Acidobacteriota bacterium]
MRVLKFGGTSLSHPHRLDTVARRVKKLRADGPVVVVVSALGGVTDELTAVLDASRRGEPAPGLRRRLRALHLEDPEKRLDRRAAAQLGDELDRWLRELDGLIEGIARLGEAPRGAIHRLLATGERLSAPRAAAWLRAAGVDATVVDGTRLLRADYDLSEPRSAPPRIDAQATRRSVLDGLDGLIRGEVPVVTGFIGGDVHGRTVTLGRGASDLSATTLAAALQADAVEIWSDTDGVLNADPRRVPGAEPLRELSFAQAAALARYGAKVLHPETLEPVRRAALPVILRSTFQPEAAGTRLVETETGTRTEARPATAPSPKALAATTLAVTRLEMRSAPAAPLASQALAVLERCTVAPLALTCGHGRLELWLRAADAEALEAPLRRQLRPLGGVLRRHGESAAVALLPASPSATALLADLSRCLGQHGLAVKALFVDRVEGSGTFSDEPNGPELAVAVVDPGAADLALRAAHGSLVAPGPGLEACDMDVAASG